MPEAGDVYREFMRNAELTALAAIDRKFSGDKADRLRGILREVLQELQSTDAVLKVEQAWRRLDKQRHRSGDLLKSELQFINSLYDSPNYAEDGTAPIETGKDSLEELLGDWLPNWFKGLLKLLNEIFDLVK